YLMTFGGVNDKSKLPVRCGIGWENSLRLWWNVQRYSLRPTHGFYMAAWSTIGTARQLNLPIEPVACSWVAVGGLTPEKAKDRFGVDCPKEVSAPPTVLEKPTSTLVTSRTRLIECPGAGL